LGDTPMTAQPPQVLEMWFDFASPYSYLAMERVHDVAARQGLQVALRPFLLGPIFQDVGWQDSPFRVFPRKGEYMMRDVARLAQKYGVGFSRPTVFPRMSVLAARVAMGGQDQDWCPAFCRAVFRENFQHDRDIQSPEVLGDVLRGLGLPAEALLERATGDAARHALREQVEQARRRGVFGAPTFFAGDEMFWGNDRLEDAAEWAAQLARAGERAASPAEAGARA
jgi:2-hydroxychromene-2-carboxylate isomerase